MVDDSEIPTTELAEKVSEVVSEIVEEENRQEVLAEEFNKALVESMLASERGRIMDQLAGEITICRERLAELETKLTETEANCLALLLRMEAQELATAALTAASLIPPVSSPSPIPEKEAAPELVQVESLPEPEPEKKPPQEKRPEKARRRFL